MLLFQLTFFTNTIQVLLHIVRGRVYRKSAQVPASGWKLMCVPRPRDAPRRETNHRVL
jgi:hypothetical protein